jgi:tRNA(fMet)-specific endonuclease VapC
VLINEMSCRDFDSKAASIYGKIRARLEKKGHPIGPNDMLIAAHALSLDLVLVSDNIREFTRVRGLQLENWRV